MANEKEVSVIIRARDAATGVLKQIENASDKAGEHLFSLGEALRGVTGALGALSLGAIIADVVSLGVATDATFRQIAAALPTGTEGIANLREELDHLAIHSGHSLEEVHALAVEIAKLGVASAEEVSQQAQAALLLSDATGASLQGAAELLIHLRREFGLTGEQALKTAADLAASARGKVAIDELTTAFVRATPTFQKLKIAADEGTAAIVSLVSAGHSARAIGGELGKIDAQGIRELAKETKIAADALDQLRARAALVEEGTGRAAEKVKTAFNVELDKLGTVAATHANPYLEELVRLLSRAEMQAGMAADAFEELKKGLPASGGVSVPQQEAVSDVERVLGQKGVKPSQLFVGQTPQDLQTMLGVAKALTAATGQHQVVVDALTAALGRSNEAEQTNTAAQDAATKKHADAVAKILAESEARVEAANKVKEHARALVSLREQLATLLATTDQSKSKTEQFAAAITAYQVKAKEAGKSTTDIAADVARLNDVLDVLAGQEAAKHIADDAKDAEEAFRALNDAIASLSGDPLAQLDAQLQTTLDKLDKNRKELEHQRDEAVGAAAVTGGDPSAAAAATQQLDDFNAGVQRIKDSYNALRAAVAETVRTEKEFGPLQKLLEEHKVTAGQLVTAFDQFKAAEADVQAKQKAALDPKVAAEYGRELQFIQSILKLIDRDWSDMFAPAENNKNQVLEIAAAWATVARTILGAVQALGKVGNATAAIVTDVVNAGEGIAKIFGGKKAEGATEALSSIGGLINVISNMGHAASQAQQRAAELTAEMDKLFQGIADALSPTKGNSLAEQKAKAEQDFADKRNTIERDLGGKANQTAREKALDKLRGDEDAYLAMLDREDAEKQQQLQEDYHVRELRAKGLDLEADALEFAERQQREYTAAVAAGDDAMTLAALHTAQTAEAIEHAVKSHLAAALAAVSQSDQIHHVDTSTTAGAVQSFSEKAQQYSAIGGALGDLFHGLDLNHLSPEQIAGLDTSIQDLFDQLKTAPDSVDTAGLSINDFINALLDLSGAATSVASTIKSAAQQISDAENQISVADSILGTSGIQSVNEYASAYGIDLSPFEDVTNPDKPAITKQGRDQAIEYLRNLFKGLDKTNPDYSLTSHEIQTLIQGLSGLSFDATDAGAGGAFGGIPAGQDSYHAAAIGTVTGISDAEAGGILGELATANTYLAVLPEIRDMMRFALPAASATMRLPNYASYWPGNAGAQIGQGIGAGIGSSFGAAAASALSGSGGSGGPITIIAPLYIDGRKIAEAIADAYLDPGSYQQLDRANARAVNRARAGAGLAKKK